MDLFLERLPPLGEGLGRDGRTLSLEEGNALAQERDLVAQRADEFRALIRCRLVSYDTRWSHI